jgi:hypothetical protein
MKNAWTKRIEELEAQVREKNAQIAALKGGEGHDSNIIEDGFGSAWSAYCAMCGKKTMEIVRPGKVQCSNCG